MAILLYAFEMVRNMITHGRRQELHSVTYTTDTQDPDILIPHTSTFLEDVEPPRKWTPPKKEFDIDKPEPL